MFDQSKGRVGPIFARSDHLGDLPHLMYSKVFRVLLVRVVCSYSYLRILFVMQRNEAFYTKLFGDTRDSPYQDASSLYEPRFLFLPDSVRGGMHPYQNAITEEKLLSAHRICSAVIRYSSTSVARSMIPCTIT